MKFVVAALFLIAVCQASITVSVAHASPDAPPVDIYVNGSILYSNLAFSQFGAVASVPAGVYEATVYPAGKTAPTLLDVLIPATADGSAYLIAAVNPLNYLNLEVYTERPSAPSPGNVYVNFLHASPDAPPVDIAVVGVGVVFSFQTYLNQSPAIAVAQGTYTFQVLLAGTSTVVLTVPNVSLTSKSYTVVAEGLVQAGTLQAALFQQA